MKKTIIIIAFIITRSALHAQTIDTVCDRLSYVKKISNTFYLLDLGGVYPNQRYTVILKGQQDMRGLLALKDSLICIAGKKQIYKGKPQWVISGRFKTVNKKATEYIGGRQ